MTHPRRKNAGAALWTGILLLALIVGAEAVAVQQNVQLAKKLRASAEWLAHHRPRRRSRSSRRAVATTEDSVLGQLHGRAQRSSSVAALAEVAVGRRGGATVGIEPVTVIAITTAVVYLVNFGVTWYRRHKTAQVHAELQEIQDASMKETLSRCVQIRVLAFQMQLFQTAVGYFTAHTGALLETLQSDKKDLDESGVKALARIEQKLGRLGDVLNDLTVTMTEAVCNDGGHARTVASIDSSVTDQHKELGSITKQLVEDLKALLISSVSAALTTIEMRRRHENQDAIEGLVDDIKSAFDMEGGTKTGAEVIKDLIHAIFNGLTIEQLRSNVRELIENRLHGFIETRLKDGPGKLLRDVGFMIQLSSLVTRIAAPGSAAGAALGVAGTGVGLAAAVHTLGRNIAGAFRDQHIFQSRLATSRVNAQAVSASMQYRQCLISAGSLEIGEQQHKLLKGYVEKLLAVLKGPSADGSVVGRQAFGGELAKRFVRQCKFAANLCRATFQNPVVRETISSVSPELIAQVEHWSRTGPITDFAVTTSPEDAKAMMVMGFELAISKPIGGERDRPEGSAAKAVWLWQCRMCSKRPINKVAFRTRAPSGSQMGIRVGPSKFIVFTRSDVSLEDGGTIPAIRSLGTHYAFAFFDAAGHYLSKSHVERLTMQAFDTDVTPWDADEGRARAFQRAESFNAQTLQWRSENVDPHSTAVVDIGSIDYRYDPHDLEQQQSLVDSGYSIKEHNHHWRSGDFYFGLPPADGVSHVSVKPWSMVVTRRSYEEGSKQSQFSDLVVCSMDSSVWMYLPCSLFSGTDKRNKQLGWVWRELRHDVFPHGSAPRKGWQSSLALIGRIASPPPPPVPSSSSSVEVAEHVAKLQSFHADISKSWTKQLKPRLQCTLCQKVPTKWVGDATDSCLFASDALALEAPEPLPMDAWFDGVGLASCTKEKNSLLKTHDELLSTGFKSGKPWTLDDLKSTTGVGTADAYRRTEDADQSTLIRRILDQLHEEDCRSRIFFRIQADREGCASTGGDASPQPVLNPETGEISEQCVTGSPMAARGSAPSDGAYDYVIELALNQEGELDAPTALLASDIEKSWEKRWWMLPTEFTWGGPHHISESDQKYKPRDAHWSFFIRWNFVLWVRVWTRLNVALPESYGRESLCSQALDLHSVCARDV